MSWVLSLYGDLLTVMRWVAAVVFIAMGILLLRAPAKAPDTNSRLTKPGVWAGMSVGFAAVIGNPKAILFYMGFLPGFFDLGKLSVADIAVILLISALVPMLGNLGLALFFSRARALLQSPRAVQRLNRASGVLLVVVGMVIPFS